MSARDPEGSPEGDGGYATASDWPTTASSHVVRVGRLEGYPSRVDTQADTLPLEAETPDDDLWQRTVRSVAASVSTATLVVTPAGQGGVPSPRGPRPSDMPSYHYKYPLPKSAGTRFRSAEGQSLESAPFDTERRPPLPTSAGLVGNQPLPSRREEVEAASKVGPRPSMVQPCFESTPMNTPPEEGERDRDPQVPERRPSGGPVPTGRPEDTEAWETASEASGERCPGPPRGAAAGGAPGGGGDGDDDGDDEPYRHRRQDPRPPPRGRQQPEPVALLTPAEYQKLYDRQQGVTPARQPDERGDAAKKVVVKQRKYDGTTDWMDFRLQFETNARANRWEGDDLFFQLVGSLEGDALSVYGDNPDANTYHDLCQKMEARFASKDCAMLDQHLFDSLEFDSSKQTPASYGAQVQRLAKRALGRDANTIPYLQTLLITRFCDGLPSEEAVRWVLGAQPKSLRGAIAAFSGYWCRYGRKEKLKKPQPKATINLVEAGRAVAEDPAIMAAAAAVPKAAPSEAPNDKGEGLEAILLQQKRAVQSMLDKQRADVQGMLQQCTQLLQANPGAPGGGGGGGGTQRRRMRCHYCKKDGTHSWRVCRKLKDDQEAGITSKDWKPTPSDQKAVTYPAREVVPVTSAAPAGGQINMVGAKSLNPEATKWIPKDEEGSDGSSSGSLSSGPLNGDGQ